MRNSKTREQRDLWLAANGYNEPMLVRFLDWVRRCVTGEFGKSRLYNAPVSTVLWSRVGASAILAGAFFAVLVPLSLSLGVIAGMREGSGLDRGISLLSILTTSIPPCELTISSTIERPNPTLLSLRDLDLSTL